jgi:hypothetical protein
LSEGTRTDLYDEERLAETAFELNIIATRRTAARELENLSELAEPGASLRPAALGRVPAPKNRRPV